jgi:hypothetical protein
MFHILDMDCKGFVSHKDLKAALDKLGLACNESDARLIASRFGAAAPGSVIRYPNFMLELCPKSTPTSSPVGTPAKLA